jgi:hypothetical protein
MDMNAMRKFEVVKSDLAPMAAHPEYAAEAAKLAELKARRETVRMEIGEVDRAISLRVLADDEDAMAAKALALLDGTTLPDNDDLVTKLRQLRELHAVLGRAITMQRRRLADIAERLSDDAAEAAEGEHTAPRLRACLLRFANCFPRVRRRRRRGTASRAPATMRACLRWLRISIDITASARSSTIPKSAPSATLRTADALVACRWIRRALGRSVPA